MSGHRASVDTAPADPMVSSVRYGVPPSPTLHVSRPRLLAALDASANAPLVLVSGPAGSGKTSLVAEWLHTGVADDDTVVWVTFEDVDTRLWQPLLEALSRQGLRLPDLDEHPHADLLLGRARLAALAAAVAGSDRRWTVVLDGYELRTPEVAAEVSYLVDHSVGRLRLVVAARVDPVLPLYRYRLDDTLVEVRAADLAFTDAEAAELLERGRVALDAAAVHDLNTRLGGWAAGLRFTARALVQHEHPEESAAAVVDQDSDINEYLLAEVLQVQEPATRLLLLTTCVPDVLYPGLAEELAGPHAGRGLLDLARSNAFLEPVPDQPGCHRYHPFFRDLLRVQLAWEDPESSARLHRRAAAWLRGQGMWTRSVSQLATGGLWSDAAGQLVEDGLVARLLLGQDERLLEIARAVPLEEPGPAPGVVRAALALLSCDSARCAEELVAARAAADPADATMACTITLVDVARACTADDADVADELVAEAARVVDILGRAAGPEADGLLDLAGAIVALRRGRLEHARAALTRLEEVGGLPARFRAAMLGYRALTEALDGRLTQARRYAVLSLTVTEDAQVPPEERNPAASTALAVVALERYNLPAARQHVTAARSCRAIQRDPACRTITAGVLAHLEAASGPDRPVLDHLESLSDRSAGHDPWLAGWLRVQSAALSVAHGHPDQALHTLDATGDDLTGGAVLAAAAYTEKGRKEDVERSLGRARNTPRTLPVEVTRLLLEGVQESRRHSPGHAASLVDRALRLASQEEVRRPFREASPSVRRLLAGHRQLVGRHPWLGVPDRSAGSAAQVVSAPDPRAPSGGVAGGSPVRAPASSADDPTNLSGLVLEPLTSKEREVLGHLEELLTTEEMAEKMFVSVNTIRTHVRSILRKLGVNRRNSAVRRARELGLFDRPPTAP